MFKLILTIPANLIIFPLAKNNSTAESRGKLWNHCPLFQLMERFLHALLVLGIVPLSPHHCPPV